MPHCYWWCTGCHTATGGALTVTLSLLLRCCTIYHCHCCCTVTLPTVDALSHCHWWCADCHTAVALSATATAVGYAALPLVLAMPHCHWCGICRTATGGALSHCHWCWICHCPLLLPMSHCHCGCTVTLSLLLRCHTATAVALSHCPLLMHCHTATAVENVTLPLMLRLLLSEPLPHTCFSFPPCAQTDFLNEHAQCVSHLIDSISPLVTLVLATPVPHLVPHLCHTCATPVPYLCHTCATRVPHLCHLPATTSGAPLAAGRGTSTLTLSCSWHSVSGCWRRSTAEPECHFATCHWPLCHSATCHSPLCHFATLPLATLPLCHLPLATLPLCHFATGHWPFATLPLCHLPWISGGWYPTLIESKLEIIHRSPYLESRDKTHHKLLEFDLY
jgi:hypothetical protein